MPLGVIWFRYVDNSTAVEILNIFVFEPVRRCGLATYMLAMVFRCMPDVQKVVTDTGSKSGLPWMKACGFKKCGPHWVKRRTKKR